MRLFSELRILKIDKMEEDSMNLERVEDTITMIISKAPQLETISIERLSSPKIYQLFDLYSVFDFHLPHSPLHPLRNLALQNMTADLDHIVTFFRNYASTLIIVRFTDMTCENAFWSTILERLKALAFPNLRKFRLESCFSFSNDG